MEIIHLIYLSVNRMQCFQTLKCIYFSVNLMLTVNVILSIGYIFVCNCITSVVFKITLST